MKAMCAWCQGEGVPALLGEREPLDDPSETHGICDRHRRAVLLDLYARSHAGLRLLLVVAPQDTQLYRYLTRSFAGVTGVEVIVDRRQRDNRRRESRPTSAERRAGDRRIHVPTIHGLGYQTVRFGKV
jgi:hypothetical protein